MSTQLKPIRVLIVDDHPLLRDGIASLIGAEPDMELVAQAANGREGLAQFKLKRPDVTLMDLQMPDVGGIEAIIAIRCEFPNARGARAYLLLACRWFEPFRAERVGPERSDPEGEIRLVTRRDSK